MGNSSSTSIDEVDSTSDFKKLIHRYNLQNKVTKGDLMKILEDCDKTFVTNLCDHYSDKGEINENNFNDIIENLYFKSSEQLIKFLFRICKIDSKITESQIKLIIKWISFSISDPLCDIIFHSYSKSMPHLNEFDTEHFLYWINRNFNDLGSDFSKYIQYIINSDISQVNVNNIESEFLQVIQQLNSSIITASDLEIIFGCLPIIYKSSDIDVQFSFQNCNQWYLLYNSDNHGLSSSRLKESSFDYQGPLLVLFKSSGGVYCLASDVGLREDWSCYGTMDTRLIQLSPFYQKYLSGSNSGGIIYSHFSAKSGRKGLFVGHNPLQSPALEMGEDCQIFRVLGRSEQLICIEVWAVGSGVTDKTARLRDIRHWETREVAKNRDRKLKPNRENWEDNIDRQILDMGGVSVHHADLIGE